MYKYKSCKGSVALTIIVSIILLLGIIALVTDIGMVVYHKSLAQKACDSAALAGAQELPESIIEAKKIAINYADNNKLNNVVVTFNNNTEIIVKGKMDVDFFFARVLGLNKTTVNVQSVAKVGALSKIYGGIRPFGVVKTTYIKGQEVKLKVDVEESHNGNFHALAIDGNGAKVYNQTIITGSKSGVAVGDYVETEPGNMSTPTIKGVEELIDKCTHSPKCTFQNYNSNCSRIIIVPIIDSFEVNGRKEVLVTGFAKFFLDDIKKENGGHTSIYGYFIEDVDLGDIDSSIIDYGLSGIKLIK